MFEIHFSASNTGNYCIRSTPRQIISFHSGGYRQQHTSLPKRVHLFEQVIECPRVIQTIDLDSAIMHCIVYAFWTTNSCLDFLVGHHQTLATYPRYERFCLWLSCAIPNVISLDKNDQPEEVNKAHVSCSFE